MVPIIENTPEEKDLKERMAKAMEEYPDSCAVLVRRHGVYVWGETWEKAKTMWVQLRNMVYFAIIPQNFIDSAVLFISDHCQWFGVFINFWPHWIYGFARFIHDFSFQSILNDRVPNIFLLHGQVWNLKTNSAFIRQLPILFIQSSLVPFFAGRGW